MQNTVIQTKNLILKPYEDAYLSDYFNGYTEIIAEYQYLEPAESLEEFRKQMYFCKESISSNDMEIFVITKDDTFIGIIEITDMSKEIPEAGIWIIEFMQNKGYGTEAFSEVLIYLKNAGYSKIYYNVDERNIPSIKLLKHFNHTYLYLKFETTENLKRLHLRTYIINL